MKNRLSDLNNHLFGQLERLSDETLTAEQIEQEVKRADAMVSVSEQIIRNTDQTLKAAHLVANHGDRFMQMLPTVFDQPRQIEGSPRLSSSDRSDPK